MNILIILSIFADIGKHGWFYAGKLKIYIFFISSNIKD